MMETDEKQIALALRARRATPPLGFDSRVLHGAYARLKTRRRFRSLLVSANVALAMAACVVLVRGAVMRPSSATAEAGQQQTASTPLPSGPDIDGPTAVRELLRYQDFQKDLAVHARWDRISQPLDAYAVFLGMK
jgi:hypothetical protein